MPNEKWGGESTEAGKLSWLVGQVKYHQLPVMDAILAAYNLGQDSGLGMARGVFPRSGMSVVAVSTTAPTDGQSQEAAQARLQLLRSQERAVTVDCSECGSIYTQGWQEGMLWPPTNCGACGSVKILVGPG